VTTSGKGNAKHFGLSERANLPALHEYLQGHPSGLNRATSRVDPGKRILPMGQLGDVRLLPKWSKDIIDRPPSRQNPNRVPANPADLLKAKAIAGALAAMMARGRGGLM
jgi:hypothetical protein